MTTYKPGDVIQGKYEIGARLGTGGMGTVFAAQHLTLGGLVALKFLLPDLAARPDIAKRFLQEARAGRSITSAHVAKVHDIDSFGDVPFIVMEHLDGETLAAHLARRGALPVDEAIDLALQACEAVNEAHIDRALALAPENRFASVEAFAASIAQFGTKAGGASLDQIQRVAERALGCVRIARAKMLGDGVAKDTSGGLGQLDAMCARGEVEGCVGLAKVYERGLGDVQASSARNTEYLKKACDLHDVESCAHREFDKMVDLTATMPARINAALRDQCNAGKAKSCEQLGRNLQSGTGAPKDEVAGAEYLAKACGGGETTACGAGAR